MLRWYHSLYLKTDTFVLINLALACFARDIFIRKFREASKQGILEFNQVGTP